MKSVVRALISIPVITYSVSKVICFQFAVINISHVSKRSPFLVRVIHSLRNYTLYMSVKLHSYMKMDLIFQSCRTKFHCQYHVNSTVILSGSPAPYLPAKIQQPYP